MIIMVTTVTTPGGVWRHVCDSALALQGRGHAVRVAVPSSATPLRADARAHGLTLHDNGRYPSGTICHFHLADTFDRVLLRQMAVARRSGCAVVVTEHLPRTDASDTSLTEDPQGRAAWFAKALFKTAQFRLASATVAVSDSSARFLAVRYGRKLREIDVVRNGVGQLGDAGAAPMENAPPIVAAAGAMLRQKGFDVLVRAVAESRGGWEVRIAGEGPHLAALRQLARDLGIAHRATFLGWQDSARLLFRESSVVVVTSRWEAAAPYVVLEAMSEGRPVVASRFGGVDEVLVDGTTGVLVPVDDHVQLAEALDALLADPDRCAAMGAAGRKRLDELPGLSVEEMIDALLAIYDRVSRRPAVTS